jgi:hypothetical protein
MSLPFFEVNSAKQDVLKADSIEKALERSAEALKTYEEYLG